MTDPSSKLLGPVHPTKKVAVQDDKALVQFKQRKDAVLSRIDKSSKGSIDKGIRKIVDIINTNEGFFTSSSCSGRIHILYRHSMKKHDIVSIFQSHDPIKVDDILERILSFVPKRPGRILFRYEPAIVHVGCRTLELAKRFYLLAREAGFFRPGILTIDNPLVEVVGNDKMEAPIADLDGMKVKDDYIRFLVDCANERMVQNQQRLKVFRNILEEKL